MTELKLLLLGSPQVLLDGQTVTGFNTRKDRALLVYLAMTGATHSREEIAGLLWSELPEDKARRNLRHALTNLRKVIGPQWIETNHGVAMTQELPWSVDALTLQATVANLEQQSSAEALTQDRLPIDDLDQALKLYRGEFLQGFYIRNAIGFEEWVLAQREEHRLLALHGLEVLVQQCLDQGDYVVGLSATRRLLQLEPWSEPAHCLQMKLLAQSGQRGAALVQFESCRQILADELDIAPMSETVALYEQIRKGDYTRNSPTDSPLSSSPPVTSVTSTPPGPSQMVDEEPDDQKKNPDSRQEEQSQGAQDDPTTNHAHSTIRHNLPASLITLIGYADELSYAKTQLSSNNCRLLTIVGLGGVGKTHLALEVARQIVGSSITAAQFRDGVYFVALDASREEAAAEEAEMVIALAIAEAIGYTFSGDRSPQVQLQTHLKNKKVLLILDNMEHLVAGAPLVTILLQQSVFLSILATSREKLDLQSEHVLDLRGLNSRSDVPPMENDAVAFFAYRAQLTDRHFRVDEENIDDIVRICELVDGLPLGIELAVRLLEVFDCATIKHEISQSLDLLMTTRRDISQRHHTLRAVFDQSWALLSPDQQAILAQLSFFRPNFQAAAALFVAGASPHDLSSLVNKSLMGRTADGHFTLHRAIRQFSREKMAHVNDNPSDNLSNSLKDSLNTLEDRYVSFYTGLLAQYTESINSAKWLQVETEILNDIANVKAALRLAIQRNMWTGLRPTVESVVNLYDTHGWFLEGAKFAKSAVDRLALYLEERQAALPISATPAEQHELEALMGHLAMLQGFTETRLGRFASAEIAFQHSLATLRKATADINTHLDNRPNEPVSSSEFDIARYSQETLESSLKLYGLLEYQRGRPEAALALLQESVPQETSHNGVSVTFFGLARVMCELGDYPEAQEHAQTAIQLARNLGEERFIIFSMIELARINQAQGAYATAEALFQECYEAHAKIGDQTGLVITLGHLGDIARLQGNYTLSDTYIQRGLALAEEIEYVTAHPQLRWALGNLALAQGDYAAAKAHFLESQSSPGFNHFTVGLPTLGWVHVGLAEFQEAEQYFQEVVQEAWQTQAKLDLLEGLGGLIVLLRIAGQFEQPEEALIIIDKHPAATQETKERIRKIYTQMVEMAPPVNRKAYLPAPGLRQSVEEIMVAIRNEN